MTARPGRLRARPYNGAMRTLLLVAAVATLSIALVAPQAALAAEPLPTSAAVAPDAALARLLEAARSDTLAMPRLQVLTDEIGARLAGSEALVRATIWGELAFRGDAQENVRHEKVMVPAWVRGRERLAMLAPQRRELAVLGLGGSVGTPGLEASVAVVHSFADLSPAVAGKIVLFDVPMSADPPALQQYGKTAYVRAGAAARAAEFGAVAALVRSITAQSLYTPHTGSMQYDERFPRIPAAAVTTEDAGWIDRLVSRGIDVRLRLEMGAETRPDAESANVLAEIVGSERPEEIVVVGGHLDSWDVGQGAHDDGVGIVHTIETLRLIRALGLKPKRTIRAVLFTNEENGLRGGKAYAEAHGGERHVAAVETDLGGGRPVRWGATGTEEQLAFLRRAAAPLGIPVGDGGGADISPLKEKGVLLVGLYPEDELYMAVHHTAADTFDKVDPDDFRAGLAAVAGLVWRLANEPL